MPDADDLCPGEAPGAHPDPARAGCPLADEDHDGVPDAEDACPKDPGDAHPGDAKTNGCPKLTSRRGGVLQLRSVHFETNKWELLPESFPILDEVVRFLQERRDLDEVVIEGHADDRGTHEWNLGCRIIAPRRWSTTSSTEGRRAQPPVVRRLRRHQAAQRRAQRRGARAEPPRRGALPRQEVILRALETTLPIVKVRDYGSQARSERQ